jgi:hypothetical protein
MTNMTLAIPEELHKIIKKHKEIKWSEVAREALWNKARKIELVESLTEQELEQIKKRK